MKLQRKRKFRELSSSEEYEEETGNYSPYHFNAGKDIHRVCAGKTLPTLWPYTIGPTPSQARDVTNKSSAQIKHILEKYGLKNTIFNPYSIADKQKQTFRVFLVCDTQHPREGSADQWDACANELQNVLEKEIGRLNTDLKMYVEIRNERLMVKDVSSVILVGSAEYHAWNNQLHNVVHTSLVGNIPGEWRSFGFWMRHRFQDPQIKKCATIMIKVNPHFMTRWDLVEDRICYNINEDCKLDFELDIQILPGEISRAIPPGHGPQYYRQLPILPINGQSIGPRGSLDSGTLGIWVLFHPRGASKPIKCFLTCYHVVRTGDKENMTDNDLHGIQIGGNPMKKDIIVDWPSPADAAATKRLLMEEINNGNDPTGEKHNQVQRLNALEKIGVGKVIHASGYSTYDNRILDWALVACSNEFADTENLVPDLSKENLGTYEWKTAPNEVIEKIGQAEAAEEEKKDYTNLTNKINDNWAVKLGRTTRTTIGYINAVNETVRQDELKNGLPVVSSEIAVLSQIECAKWAMPGDSGSVVINRKKEWIGMVWGIGLRDDVTYISPAAFLIRDIESSTGGKIELPKKK